MVKAELRSGRTDHLVADIEKHGSHLTTGFLGTPFLLFVLDAQGRELHVFREPDDGDFRVRELFKPGDRVSPLFAEGRAEIAVADLFS